MDLNVPDHLVRGIALSEAEWRLDLALGLYVDDRVTLGRAAEIANVSKPAFLDELGKRRIPIHYELSDLNADLETIASLRADGPKQPK